MRAIDVAAASLATRRRARRLALCCSSAGRVRSITPAAGSTRSRRQRSTIGFGLRAGQSRGSRHSARPFATSRSKGWSRSTATAGRDALARRELDVVSRRPDRWQLQSAAERDVSRRHAVTASDRARHSRRRELPAAYGTGVRRRRGIQRRRRRRARVHAEAAARPSARKPRRRRFSKAGRSPIGTGPFHAVEPRDARRGRDAGERALLRAASPPSIESCCKTYPSVRPPGPKCCAGSVDMLYEVGIDALDSLDTSTDVKVFTFQRPYAYIGRSERRTRPRCATAPSSARAERRDRSSSARSATRSTATASRRPDRSGRSTGPTTPTSARFRLRRRRPTCAGRRHRSRCLLRRSHRTSASRLRFKQQLRAVGVELTLEQRPDRTRYSQRLKSGDFDAVLIDVVNGPTCCARLCGGTRAVRSTAAATAARGGRRARHASSTPPTTPRTRPASRRSSRRSSTTPGDLSGLERAGPSRQHAVRGAGRTRPRHPEHPALWRPVPADALTRRRH